MVTRFLALFIIVAICLMTVLPTVSGARVFGTIYDSNLNTVSAVVVEVNSTPIQRHISRYGGYSFELLPGTYEITATYTLNGTSKEIAREFVTVISRDGEYIVDLFIFPHINLERGFIEEEKSNFPFNIGIFIFVLLGTLLGITSSIIWFKRDKPQDNKTEKGNNENNHSFNFSLNYNTEHDEKKTEETLNENKNEPYTDNTEDDMLKKRILKILHQNNNSLTQKEIRKKIDLSESKISQIISDLVKEEKVRKIKKGRTNIIQVN